MNLENKKQIAIILLAIGLGLISAVLTANHIQKSIGKERTRIAKDFEEKHIKPLNRKIVSLQQDLKKVASRPAVVSQVVQPKTPALPKSSLALRTPAGKRAYVVRIDALSAVGGLINPGDFVDVIAHLDMPDPETKKKNTISTMVFQNIQILAVGTNLQAPGGYEQQQKARALNITFALTPEEANLMSFIEKNGKVQLVLRAPAETDTEIIQTASWPALADYVFEKQGTELVIPRARTFIQPVSTTGTEEVKPFIQIFQEGKEY